MGYSILLTETEAKTHSASINSLFPKLPIITVESRYVAGFFRICVEKSNILALATSLLSSGKINRREILAKIKVNKENEDGKSAAVAPAAPIAAAVPPSPFVGAPPAPLAGAPAALPPAPFNPATDRIPITDPKMFELAETARSLFNSEYGRSSDKRNAYCEQMVNMFHKRIVRNGNTVAYYDSNLLGIDTHKDHPNDYLFEISKGRLRLRGVVETTTFILLSEEEVRSFLNIVKSDFP